MESLAGQGWERRSHGLRQAANPVSASSVYRVTQQGMTHRREVNTNLMRPSGLEPAFDKTGVPAERRLDGIVRARRLSAPGHDRHLLAVRRAASDVLGDDLGAAGDSQTAAR